MTPIDDGRHDPPRATICLTFDNLGEAADVEMGRWPEGRPFGQHYTATKTVPRLIEELDGLPATFFVEGWNAEVYPDLLRTMAATGHEIACHGWRHELWSTLDDTTRRRCLRQAIDAFARIGVAVQGLRPPGGFLPDGVLALVGEADLAYVSAAGDTPSIESGVVSLPFRWIDLDGFYLDPAAAKTVGLEVPSGVEPTLHGFFSHLDDVIADLTMRGGQAVVVMHPYIIETTEGYWAALQSFLGRLRANQDIALSTCGRSVRRVREAR
ncbi:polysaccharide deacetylase family protein [Sphingomonas histidinilytica]|uniref:Chitooligosaccharide deacetylase n=1 Tax=Rhizorhabdus histidinilytica TaxID=439228 RepID=A0A1T5FLX6_9SPHN|nr:polysaccharide deacetylase family protein [Rhizorhabdus histidinilytica]MBO9380093.1 polysaccharide deacetylase family protein [Rhizorhabdus histidinilytica]SKB97180.1 Polysaccharide deacetylase [Rhizorhabdus histidinilytica]